MAVSPVIIPATPLTISRAVSRVKVEAEVGSIPMILIQNKIDLVDKAVVTPEETKALADKAWRVCCVFMVCWHGVL